MLHWNGGSQWSVFPPHVVSKDPKDPFALPLSSSGAAAPTMSGLWEEPDFSTGWHPMVSCRPSTLSDFPTSCHALAQSCYGDSRSLRGPAGLGGVSQQRHVEAVGARLRVVGMQRGSCPRKTNVTTFPLPLLLWRRAMPLVHLRTPSTRFVSLPQRARRSMPIRRNL